MTKGKALMFDFNQMQTFLNEDFLPSECVELLEKIHHKYSVLLLADDDTFQFDENFGNHLILLRNLKLLFNEIKVLS